MPTKDLSNRERADLIVCLTSFPARINHAWIPIECMLRQTVQPKRILLTLALSEFPNRELPKRLQDQCDRGLEILWVEENTKAYKKLLPAVLSYPEDDILTIDDDVFYPRSLVADFVAARREFPGMVIGGRGWEILLENGELMPYRKWPRANVNSPKDRLLLTGVGGLLYPAGLLPVETLLDIEQALTHCPSNDDIWFWAVAQLAGVKSHCLGLPEPFQVAAQRSTPHLADINVLGGANDVQFNNVLVAYPEIAQSLHS